MKHTTFILVFFCTLQAFAQGFSDFQSASDPFQINENILSSPETASLGQFGELSASPYNGTANVNVPIYNLNWEGLSIPINLSYDTAGVRVASEASWVGLNWNLSSTFAVHRKIYGQDDLDDSSTSFYEGLAKVGYIYNNIDLELEEGAARPYLDYNNIINMHYSFSLNSNQGQSRALDTQPDVFTLSALGKKYTFILNKKGAGDIISTSVFNNNNANITYNLANESFTLIDENGFTFTFNSKEINTSFNSVQIDGGGGPPIGRLAAAQSVFVISNRHDFGVTTSWYLDNVVSPNGRELDFSYTSGLHLSFPTYSVSGEFQDANINTTRQEQFDKPFQPSTHNVSTTVIENQYLTEISGDFGKINFELGERSDLATGHTLDEISQGAMVFIISGTETQIWDCHGNGSSCAGTNLLPKKLDGITVEDHSGNTIIDANFNYNYFNSHKVNEPLEERFIRLKLNEVVINDLKYEFDYINPNSLSAKDSFGVDFWGFDNGQTDNETLVPKYGRFFIKPIHLHTTEGLTTGIGQSFVNLGGAIRKSDFNFGKRGTLNKLTYPTGGVLNIEYEAHEAVLEAPAPFTELSNFSDYTYYTGSPRYEYTNMIDESQYNSTYQYLKYTSDNTYNYFEKEIPAQQGDPVDIPLLINQPFLVEFPSIINIEGHLQTHCNWDGLEYWGNFPTVVLVNLNTGEEVTLFTYNDAPNEDANTQAVNNVISNRTILPGYYAVSRRLGTLPPGEDYDDYPGAPHVEYHSDAINLLTFENLSDSDISLYLEEFEIGGLRVKSLINETSDGDFITGKMFTYDFQGGLPDLNSSGKLMDDLLFHNKAKGFHSYNPRMYADLSLTGYNVLGGNNSAQGSHIGYSSVQEFQINEIGESLGRIETTYFNDKNGYYTDTFLLPYVYNSYGNEDAEPSRFLGIDMSWVCDLNFNVSLVDCTGDQISYSPLGDVEARNIVVLGLPLNHNFSFSNGNIKEQRIFDTENKLLEKTENIYVTLNGNVPLDYYSSFFSHPINGAAHAGDTVTIDIWNTVEHGLWGANHHTYFPYQFPLHHGLVSLLSSNETTRYYDDDFVSTQAVNSYDAVTHQLKVQRQIISEDDEASNYLYYPTDTEVYNNPNMYRLRNQNRITTIVKSEQLRNGEKLVTQEFDFDYSSDTYNNTLIEKVLVAKGDNPLETRFNIDKYDQYGNILQRHQENASTTSFVWCYNGLYPIAKIENATYSQVLGTGIDVDLLNSTSVTDAQKEVELQKITEGLPNAQITTYTHKPLLGVTSMTDPKGYTMYYEYDEQNRLKHVKDADGNIYSKNEYNYRTND